MFPVSGLQLLLILFVVAVVVGPSRLPAVAANVSRWVKASRRELAKLRATLNDEVGDELKDLDLSKLDVRQYDPRRMIREAVQEELDEWKELIRPLGTESDTTTPQEVVTSRTPSTGHIAEGAIGSSAISSRDSASHSAEIRKITRSTPRLRASQQPTARSAAQRIRNARRRTRRAERG